jgi:hypothetical protein
MGEGGRGERAQTVDTKKYKEVDDDDTHKTSTKVHIKVFIALYRSL